MECYSVDLIVVIALLFHRVGCCHMKCYAPCICCFMEFHRLGCRHLKYFDFTNLVASFVKHFWFHGPVYCHMRYFDFTDLVVVM